jgi:hypothetical protein
LIVPFALVFPIQHLTVACWLAIVAGLYFFFRGLSLLAHKGSQNAPVSKIATAPPGLVEVSGVATGSNTICTPIAGKPCYLYRTAVWQQRKTAGHQWEKIVDETLHVPFFLDDSTGQLLIEPQGADLDLQSEFHKEYDPGLFLEKNKVPPSVGHFLGRHGVTPVRRIKVEEYCIRPESMVFSVGTMTENPRGEVRQAHHGTDGACGPAEPSTPQFRRTDAPEVIRLSVSKEALTAGAMTQQAKISAALIKAGHAWPADILYPKPDPEHASAANGKHEVQQPAPQSARVLPPARVLMKGSKNAPFLISWRSQRELSRAHIWRSAVMLSGGTALTLAGLYALY